MVIVSQSFTRSMIRVTSARAVMDHNVRMVLRLAAARKTVFHTYARAALRLVSSKTAQATQHYARNLLRISPDFRWIDMFSDKVFPNNISENSDAATRFNTQVNQVASGHDQRLALWDYPLMEYNVAYGVRTMEDLHDLIRFFRVMRGKLVAFRFLDNIDYQSNFAIYDESRAPDPISSTDQLIGTGDEVTYSFQLVKHYDFEDEVATRPIYKPIPGTVIVAVDEEDVDYFSVDASTGIVTFIPRVSADLVAATLTKLTSISWSVTVPGDDTLLPIFLVGEWINVNGFAYGSFTRGVVTSSTTTEVIFTVPSSVIGTGVVNADSDAYVASDNVPRVGQAVTAGFHFHVPVRFDTDRIPVKLEYYGIGSASEIKLVEVRPDEESV